jgi:very-short-patch-repair endonuclease
MCTALYTLVSLYPQVRWEKLTRETNPGGIVDGLEMDLYFSALQLNIELDGPYHHTKSLRSFDSKRDVHLQRTDIRVHRVHILHHTPFSALQEIADTLSAFGVKPRR